MVFLYPLPVFYADGRIKGQFFAGKEILYRADYLEKGRLRRMAGILSGRKDAEGFLERMEKDITEGKERAGRKEFFIYLKLHVILCALERHAGRRIAAANRKDGKGTGDGKRRLAERIYCEELLAYVEAVRRNLNDSPSHIVLPAFPVRSC